MARHLAVGRRGERIAARYLSGTGLVVLDRNWRCRFGELDIVCADGAGLVVAEVKTRSVRASASTGFGTPAFGTPAFGTPAEAVTDEKADRIRALAVRWRVDHAVPPCPTRFDIVSVLLPVAGSPRVRHLRGAF